MGQSRLIRDEARGVLAGLLGLYLALCLATYDRWDPSPLTMTSKTVGNYGGRIGAWLADLTFSVFGVFSYVLPAILVFYAVRRVLGMDRRWVNILGASLVLIAGSTFAALAGTLAARHSSGGIVGEFGKMLLVGSIKEVGAYVVSIGLLLGGIVLLIPAWILDRLMGRKDEPIDPDQEYPHDAAAPEPQAPQPPDTEPEEPEYAPGPLRIVIGEGLQPAPAPVNQPEILAIEPPLDVPPTVAGATDRRPRQSKYRLPSIDLLKTYDPVRPPSKDELQSEAEVLEKSLSDFSVKGKITHVHVGPVVTMCEFQPAPGVKIGRVVSLSDDLALAMRAQSIRISAVPGKASIGIEVPNKNREIVSFRDMIASDQYKQGASRLSFVLGKDIFGAPIIADLARMPHLLVAGATGSGKSVFMNSTVMSLLYKSRPDEVKMLMIDPKLLELSTYEGIPHLIAPVVTSPKDASEMLRRMVFEMERRYRQMAERGVRNIDSHNAAVPAEERLPYIVVFIDELADLMLSSAGQVEDSIARLAQMARAAGIHLIIATQRPSVDVITGVIKANFPARIAFQVTSRVDSRTIIDGQGAEQLIGRGDMLFMVPGVKLLRVHGAFVTEDEVKSVVDFVKSQAPPDYSLMQEISRAEEEAKAEAESTGERDDLFWRAVEFAESTGEVSISMIQRKLKIGYNRAANIVELMVQDGMVGPPKGAGKPRDFLGRNQR